MPDQISTDIRPQQPGEPEKLSITVQVDGVDITVTAEGWQELDQALMAFAIVGQPGRLTNIATQLMHDMEAKNGI